MNIPQCFDCKHLAAKPLPGNIMACPAFPEGIPETILVNDANHKKPYPGDNGIQFELRPETKD